MANQFGNYSLYIALISSFYLIFKSLIIIKLPTKNIDSKIFSVLSIQSLMVLISFISLIYAFIISDFGNETVFNNSHTTKPIFYKVSGSWGNHEGSLLLWLLVLVIFLFIFFVKSNGLNSKYRLLTLLFQEIIILGFLLFILFTSNPFTSIFPIPKEGLGLNPILQDPALAIHPPILYIGYVGSSIIFSGSLAALISGSINKVWAFHIKKWIIGSWVFLTLGIMLGSIWAYYELGWGGFWFWDPVENVSLMPWFCLTALLHTINVLQKRNLFHSWTIILAITTFSLSMSGTFLVRSGILNSIHTFANDPSRGVFILCFLFLLIFLSVFIFFLYQKNIPNNSIKSFFLSKETIILVNNWFMMFFLSVVLIGTIYPIFLEVINGYKISIGPPFYHKLIIPFLIPFLIFMALGPKVKWIKDKFKKINLIQLIFFIVSIGISYLIISKSNRSFLFSMPLFVLSFYLLFITIKDFFAKESILSQKISHFGFSLLILSILLNGIFSNEFSSNMKIGEEKKFEDKTIKFESLNVKENTNYKSLIAEFKIIDKKSTLVLNPEVRIYNKPKTITSEADISTTLYSDNFLVFNILKNDEYYNIRYQHKPLMIWIWLSTILISVGGILSYIKKKMIRNVKFLVTIIVGLIIFLVLLKGLEKPNNYFPNNTLKKIDTNLKLKMLYKNKEISLKKIIKKDKISLINVWASWCLPCRQEHSYLVSLKENNLNIIGINYKDQEVNAKKFLKKLGNPYSEVLVDLDGTKSIEMGAIGVPETYLVNSETAEIIKKFIGPLDSLKTKEIRKILKYE